MKSEISSAKTIQIGQTKALRKIENQENPNKIKQF